MLSANFKTREEKFGIKIFHLLVENFSQTFFVGGTVRDLLLGKKNFDLDLTTSAKPRQIKNILNKNKITYDAAYEKFGVIVAKQGIARAEIATFRQDLKNHNRYPKVRYVLSPEIDSQRRDFTVNALYLSIKTNKILDFHNGLSDIKTKTLRFICNPEKRIKEDPLRIIRALRLAGDLDLAIENKTLRAINENFFLIKTLTASRAAKELDKCKKQTTKKLLHAAFDKEKILDTFFKKR